MELAGILNYFIFLGILTGIYAILALGLNIQWGLSGLFNIGIVGFFAIGAYTFGIVSGRMDDYHIGGYEMPIVFGVIVAMLLSALFAFVIGKVCLHLRSDYLAITTIGLAETIRLFLKTETWLSGGPRGIIGIPRPFSDLAYSESQLAFLALVCTIVLLVYFLLQQQIKSPWGRMMRAIRDNEISARSVGKDIEARHLHAFIFGCILMALSGALFAMLNRSITPEAMDPIHITFLIWVMLILGGSGNNRGALLGALIVTTLWSASELVTDQLPEQIAIQAKYIRAFLVGLILQLILRFRPEGLLPDFRLKSLQKEA